MSAAPFRLLVIVAALWVLCRSFLHSKSCILRLERACRLYAAGDIKEGDRVMAAVQRSRAAFQSRHPHWRMAHTYSDEPSRTPEVIL